MGSTEDPRPNIHQHPLGEDDFPVSVVLKELAEFDIEASVGFSVVE